MNSNPLPVVILEKLNYARWWTTMSESRPAAIADLARSFLNLQKVSS